MATSIPAEDSSLESVSSLEISFLQEVKKTLKSYGHFNMFFSGIALTELLCLLIFFNTLTRSSILALTLAIFVTTLFSYFILRIYHKSRMPERLLFLAQNIHQTIQKKVQHQSLIDQYLTLSNQLCKLGQELEDFEYDLYKPQKGFYSLRYTFEKLGSWLHFRDILFLKEWIFLKAIDCSVELIKTQPNNLQFHVALANTYLMMSTIYSCSKKEENTEGERWIHPDIYSPEMEQKFTLCAKRTIEEFQILNDYNPNDPWIYTQLAYCYRDLGMKEEEIAAYEKVLEIAPEDQEVCYRLGVLYFENGMNSKGLRIYEQLKTQKHQKAASLIKHYGAHLEEDFLSVY